MYGIVRLIILWVSVGLNVTVFVLAEINRRRYRKAIETYDELNELLRDLIEQENRILIKLKENQENELHS
jgi:hypothetical protein